MYLKNKAATAKEKCYNLHRKRDIFDGFCHKEFRLDMYFTFNLFAADQTWQKSKSCYLNSLSTEIKVHFFLSLFYFFFVTDYAIILFLLCLQSVSNCTELLSSAFIHSKHYTYKHKKNQIASSFTTATSSISQSQPPSPALPPSPPSPPQVKFAFWFALGLICFGFVLCLSLFK